MSTQVEVTALSSAAVGNPPTGRPLRARRSSVKRMRNVGIGMIGVVLLASLVGGVVLPEPNEQNLTATLAPPSLDHPFGTDDLGRDVLSRVLSATWLDLGLAFSVTMASVVIGLAVGSFAGYVGGWGERVLMRIVDAVIGFPYLIFVLAVVAILGPGLLPMVAAIMCFNWALYARLARGEMLVLRETAFVQAAQTLGYSHRRVVLRHAIPNLLRPILVYSMGDIVALIMVIATLSFLGLGVRPPTPEWGAIIADGQDFLTTAWWISTLPGLVVVFVGIGLILLGDAFGEMLGVRRESDL